MTFDEFKKKYAKLNALLDAADEVLTDLYQELPITEGRRGKNLIKTGNKFSVASNEYWSGLESKKVSDECKIANYELREDFKQYIDDYFNKFYE